MKRLHDAVVLLSLPSSVGSAVTVTGEITLASVTKRLRDTDENDLPKITELKDWMADNLGVKTLSLAEVLYMYSPNQTSLMVVCDGDKNVFGKDSGILIQK